MSYCPKCQKSWTDGETVCPQCGGILNNEGTEANQSKESAAQAVPAQTAEARPMRRRQGIGVGAKAKVEEAVAAEPTASTNEAIQSPVTEQPAAEMQSVDLNVQEDNNEDDSFTALWLGGRKPVIPVQRRNTSLKAQLLSAAAMESWSGDRKPWSPKAKKIAKWIGIGAASLLVLILIISLIGSQFSANSVAKSYIQAMSRKDYGAMYRLSVLSNYDTLNEKEYAVRVANTVPDFKVFEINTDSRRNSRNNDSLSAYVSYSYVDANTNYNSSRSLQLVKQPGKRWFFFDSYKVVPEDIVGYCSFNVPVGSEVTVNGKVLRGGERTDGMQYYRSVAFFPGEYEVTVKSPCFEDQTSNLTIYSNSNSNFSPANQIVLKDNIQKEIDSTQEKTIHTIWEGIKAGTPAEKMYFSEIPAENRADVERVYGSLLRNYVSNDDATSRLISFKINDIQIKDISGYDNNGWYEVRVRVNCSVDCTCKSKDGTEQSTNTDNRDLIFTYRVNNRNLKLNNISSY